MILLCEVVNLSLCYDTWIFDSESIAEFRASVLPRLRTRFSQYFGAFFPRQISDFFLNFFNFFYYYYAAVLQW